MSDSFHSQHPANNQITYVESSIIIVGTPVNSSTDHGAGAKTSEVDWDANFCVNNPSGNRDSSFNVQSNDIFNLYDLYRMVIVSL